MAHGFICPRLLSLSWDTNTHNEHIYFQFDVQNGRGLHEGSHFHYKNQKHKHSEIHPKCPWSQGVLITQRQTPRLPNPYAGKTCTNPFLSSSLPPAGVSPRMCHRSDVAAHHGHHHSRDHGICGSLWTEWLGSKSAPQTQICFAKRFEQHLPQISQPPVLFL